ncbi:MAG: hypothetical protein DI563_07695 [Variovorax paradoxus]|uniref:Uncharacterized protein n=1 Tax=Variovorax paradoxus TaxID=34073 RepID=A0A2W5QGH1_VARPD|nr:MAG: hypothetical protein DI563_07695 [Variovorax paradoxus]
MTGVSRTAVEALHTELLVEVQELARTVYGFSESIPKAVGDLKAAAEGVAGAGQQATRDFEAMAEGLLKVLKAKIAEDRADSLQASITAAEVTKKALSNFTKYFWLLIGVAGGSLVLNLVLVGVLLLKAG